LCELDKNKKLSLIYRGSRDGFSAGDFHSKCDGKSPTLTVIKTDHGYIFGGYTQAKWSSNHEAIEDPNAFIFSFRNAMNTQFKSIARSKGGILCHSKLGPCFGNVSTIDTIRINKSIVARNPYTNDPFGSMDICILIKSIFGRANTIDSSSSAFPYGFSNNGNLEKHCLNGGSCEFTVFEIEVFLLE
jgi:hypothetical protein